MVDNIRLEMTIKNNNLYNLIYKDHTSLYSFADAVGVCYVTVQKLLNLKMPIRRNDGEFRKPVLDICKHFDLIPEIIFPDDMYSLKTNKHVEIISLNQLPMEEKKQLAYFENHDNEITLKDLSKDINEQLETLQGREEECIRLRYGIGCDPHTLEGVAQIFGVTRERIRQIEAKGLRRLRHPKRAIHLKHYTGIGL